jgi:hypothetical protein
MEWYRKLAHADDVDALAKECAGNWRQFQSFYWSDKPEENADSFMVFYTHNRDSGLLDESNAAAIAKELEKSEYGDSILKEHHSHWACGWVDGYAIRCIDSNGHATPVFKALVEIAKEVNDYPVLDENDYSEREYKATLSNIRNEGQSLVKDDAPENWAAEVFSWLWENNQSAVENIDDQGGSPRDDEIREALEALGMLAEKDEE